MKLAVLMVLAPDLVEARRFYADVLGFGVIAADEDVLALDHAGVAFRVYRCEAPSPGVRHGRDAATTAVFAVDSIDEAMADLRGKGVEFLHDTPASSPFGRYAAFRAPGGNVHEIFQAQR